MSARKSKHVRRFLQAGAARLEEACVLLKEGYSLGAIYLAGYAVECQIKALILSQMPEHQQLVEIDSYRGVKSHDYGWLRNRYYSLGGSAFPRNIVQFFVALNVWNTDLRYHPAAKYNGNVDEFFYAVDEIMTFIRKRV